MRVRIRDSEKIQGFSCKNGKIKCHVSHLTFTFWVQWSILQDSREAPDGHFGYICSVLSEDVGQRYFNRYSILQQIVMTVECVSAKKKKKNGVQKQIPQIISVM